jgi:predicted CoA-binding protein
MSATSTLLTEKTTLVLGASTNPERTSYTALHMLTEAGVPVHAVGLKEGDVAGVHIFKDTEDLVGQPIHTVTLYLNAQRQAEWADYILGLQPKRIIFNPGAENPALYAAATAQGIECHNACTLVMLNFGQF